MRYAFAFVLLPAFLALSCGGAGEKEATVTVTPTVAPAATPEAAGQMLAFIRDGDLWVVRSDGSTPARLTEHSSVLVLDWSPDGTRIVFAACEPRPPGMGHCKERIFAVNADGSALTVLREDTATSALDWSPDGGRILLADASVINADGSGPTQLTEIAAYGARWSADARRIAFASSDPGGNSDIYVMNGDGSDLTRLTDCPGRDDSPAWSPGATRIALASHRDGTLTST